MKLRQSLLLLLFVMAGLFTDTILRFLEQSLEEENNNAL